MEVRAIRASEIDECLDLWAAAFGNRPYFVRYFAGDETWRPEDTSVCVVDGRLVSAVTVVRRVVGRGDLRLGMGGIANVGTLPEARGRGYSTACLRRALAGMEADPFFDFSLLGTGIHGFYGRLGWVTTPLPAWEASVPEGADFGVEEVRPATMADLPRLHAAHAAFHAGRPLAVERPGVRYWQAWCRLNEEEIGQGVWVDTRGPGHIAFRHGDRGMGVHEFVPAPDDPTSGRRLLAAALAQGEAIVRVRGPETARGDAEALLSDLRPAAIDGLMARTVGRTRLLAKLAAAAAPARGTVVFATPDGPVRVRAEGRAWRVEAVERAEEARTQEELFGLCLGAVAAPDGPLAALFPRCPVPVWNSGDGF